jgi:tRNA (cmo5U34)-methyltransferase
VTRDDIYSLPMNRVGEFQFDEQVVQVFPDMIAQIRARLCVDTVHDRTTRRLALCAPGTTVWDLGCSSGSRDSVDSPSRLRADCVIHAVDNSSAMIERLRVLLQESTETGCPVELHEADLRSVEIRNASFVVLNLTLQFLHPDQRSDVIQKVANGLNSGGALLLSEKICFADSQQQALLTDLHHDFKRAHGYSDLEISQKRSAIENLLIPETLEAHVQRLRDAGFRTVAPWFQCFNFASILAVK